MYAPILMGFISSEVKFNFKKLLFFVNFFIFLIYKKLQKVFEIFHFPTSPPFFNDFFSNFVQI